jgi:hypothetical protein
MPVVVERGRDEGALHRAVHNQVRRLVNRIDCLVQLGEDRKSPPSVEPLAMS